MIALSLGAFVAITPLPYGVTALAVRVISKPACGNKPSQSFSSCAGLAVYER